MNARLAALGIAVGLAGCGSQTPACSPSPQMLAIAPHTSTADHAAFPPHNQQQFIATLSPATDGSTCATPAHSILLHPTWTVSDPHDVSISSANDSTNGLATCLGSTSGPVTVTADISTASGTTYLTAMLYCE